MPHGHWIFSLLGCVSRKLDFPCISLHSLCSCSLSTGEGMWMQTFPFIRSFSFSRIIPTGGESSIFSFPEAGWGKYPACYLFCLDCQSNDPFTDWNQNSLRSQRAPIGNLFIATVLYLVGGIHWLIPLLLIPNRMTCGKHRFYLYWDVGVISWQKHFIPLFFPFQVWHRIGWHFTAKNYIIACEILDILRWHRNNRSCKEPTE